MGFAVQPSAWVARLLRERRQELDLTLRDVEAQTGALGDPIPFTLVARVEKGLVDPGFRRMNLLLRIYQLPTQMAGDLADLEQLGDHLPVDPEATYEEGIKAWKSGDIRKGMAHLLALTKSSESGDRLARQKAVLGLAIAAAGMSKYHLAHHIVDGLLREPPEPVILARVLIQAAVCWHRLGSADVALALLDRAERHAANDTERAWVSHNRASTFVTIGDFAAAETELARVFELYRTAGDTSNEGRARGVLVRLNVERGNLADALEVAREAQTHAKEHGHERLWIMRRIDEGGILRRLDDTEAAIAVLQDGLGRATSIQDDVCQFHAHFHLWKAFGTKGDGTRADYELRAAQFLVRFLDESTPEAVEVRATMDGKRRKSPEKMASVSPIDRAPQRHKREKPARK